MDKVTERNEETFAGTTTKSHHRFLVADDSNRRDDDPGPPAPTTPTIHRKGHDNYDIDDRVNDNEQLGGHGKNDNHSNDRDMKNSWQQLPQVPLSPPSSVASSVLGGKDHSGSSLVTTTTTVSSAPLPSTGLWNSELRIGIIGTGLAGLSTAISLEQVGYRHITLYERDVAWNVRKEGYGLTLTYDPRGILNELGVLDKLAQADCPSRSHYLFDPNGKVLGYFGNAFLNLGPTPNHHQQQPEQQPEQPKESPAPSQQQQQQSPAKIQEASESNVQACRQQRRGVGQRGNLRVPRQTVRQILLQKLQYSKIEWNHKLVDLVQCGQDQLELVFDCSSLEQPPPANQRKDKDEENNDTTCGRTRHRRIVADLVVAADGIRSSVLQSWVPRAPPPKSLGVGLILGLSQGFVHPLLNERGFYTTNLTNSTTATETSIANGGVRLFVMPFAGSRLDPVEKRRFMWQLSFSTKKKATKRRHNKKVEEEKEEDGQESDDENDDDDDDQNDNQNDIEDVAYSSQELLEQAMAICNNWHGPVPDLIRSTPISTVWGTMLYDRDPVKVYRELKDRALQRVIVVGDALHAMSPFKGAGANQALQDGRVVAQWLNPNHHLPNTNSVMNKNSESGRRRDLTNTNTNHNKKMYKKTKDLNKAVKTCVRDLAQRTQRFVLASRDASKFWHSRRRIAQTMHLLEEEEEEEAEHNDCHDDKEEESDVDDPPPRHKPPESSTQMNRPSSSPPPKRRPHHASFGEMHQQQFKFAGVSSRQSMRRLLALLEERNIRAGTCHDLDHAIAQVVLEHGLADPTQHKDKNETGVNDKERKPSLVQSHPQLRQEEEELVKEKNRHFTFTFKPQRVNVKDPLWVSEVWEATRQGDLGRLRRLSWKGQRLSCLISNIREEGTGNTPLHVAVKQAQQQQQEQQPVYDQDQVHQDEPQQPPTEECLCNHHQEEEDSDSNICNANMEAVIVWLVREAGCDLQARNLQGQTPPGLIPKATTARPPANHLETTTTARSAPCDEDERNTNPRILQDAAGFQRQRLKELLQRLHELEQPLNVLSSVNY